MNNPITRRTFVKKASTGLAAFTILKSGSARTYKANEKLNIASIGAGGRAASDIKELSGENIVALVDVDWARAANAFKTHPDAKQYKDYRLMFDEMSSEIDAVIVGTPDHHHFHASMAALRQGKHVYCEKPLTHSIWEARELRKAASKAGLATQMGNQAQANEETRRIQEFVMDGAVGPIHEVHIWTDRPSRGLFDEYWPQGVDRPEGKPAVPDTLDWDLWLGPAPDRPYNEAYLPKKWRGWWDFGTGALGDIGCHFMDPVFRALKLGAPETVGASSSRVNRETYPVASKITYRFPARGDMPPLKLVWYDGGLRPERPDVIADEDIMGTNGLLLVGDDGALISDWQTWKLLPESRAIEYGEPPKKLSRSPGHHLEFVAACKGGDPAGSNFDWAAPLTEAVLLGTIALRPHLRDELTRRDLHWDTEKFAFTNCERANKFLRREYRKGWEA